MLRFSQLAKSATIAVTIVALGASTAAARPADAVHRALLERDVAARSWTQPRIDSTGVRPITTAPAPAPPVPLVQPAADSGFDWLSAAIGGAALLSLALLLVVVRSIRTPHRGRMA